MQSYQELFGMSETFKVVNALGGSVTFSCYRKGHIS